MNKKTLIVIAGPTAAGKTSAAIALAQALGTEIISADSRQCYKEMRIGVARPSEYELALVKHHFIASHTIHEKVTAASFTTYAETALEQIFEQHETAVMVGGTGLYIKAFTDGLDEIPQVPEALNNSILQNYNKGGIEWLRGELESLDPAFAATGEMKNPHRMLRALAVFKATGRTITTFQLGSNKEHGFDIIRIGIKIPKEQLHAQINKRVDDMMKEGQLAEVKSLLPYRNLSPLQTVGYTELFEHLDGSITLTEAVEKIKLRTRQYAKRQLTWFKKDERIYWTAPDKILALPELQRLL